MQITLRPLEPIFVVPIENSQVLPRYSNEVLRVVTHFFLFLIKIYRLID
jgi:hypothetical protein